MNKESNVNNPKLKDANFHFALIVQYGTGEVVWLTNKVDVRDALNEFDSYLDELYGTDKNSCKPQILGGQLKPIAYKSNWV